MTRATLRLHTYTVSAVAWAQHILRLRLAELGAGDCTRSALAVKVRAMSDGGGRPTGARGRSHGQHSAHEEPGTALARTLIAARVASKERSR
jgi:hypothetical protein